MLTAYKIVRQVETEKGVEVTVRFYKGKVTTEEEEIRGVKQDVTRYRRLGLLKEKTFTLPAKSKRADILRSLNAELKTDKIRDPIPEQLDA